MDVNVDADDDPPTSSRKKEADDDDQNGGYKNDSSSSSLSFADAFGPLANHFFPDGCPRAELTSVWPSTAGGGGGQHQKRRQIQRQRQQRPTTSVHEAQNSLQELRDLATRRQGFTTLQISALAEVAGAVAVAMAGAPTIGPSSSTGSATTVVVRSAMASSQTFEALIRCLIFRPGHWIDPDVLSRLMSLLNVLPEDDQDDRGGRCVLLRFFTLLLLLGDNNDGDDCNDAVPIRKQLERFYPVLFAQVLRPSFSGTSAGCCAAVVVDAVRLLLHLTAGCPMHATRYRLRRLQRCLASPLDADGGEDRLAASSAAAATGTASLSSKGRRKKTDRHQPARASTTTADSATTAASKPKHRRQALSALLQLYTDFSSRNHRNQNRNHNNNSNNDDGPRLYGAGNAYDDESSEWFPFPDGAWEADFFRHDDRHRKDSPRDGGTTTTNNNTKRRRVLRLHRITTLPMSYRSLSSSSSPAADLLLSASTRRMNEVAHRLVLLDLRSDPERIRLGHNLPFLLSEAWERRLSPNPSLSILSTSVAAAATPAISNEEEEEDLLWAQRLRLVTTLSELAMQVDGLPPELETFWTTKALPVWDGSIEWTRPLAHLVAHLSPRPFADLESLVLKRFERLFPVLDGPVQQCLGAALGELVYRWGRLDWSTVGDDIEFDDDDEDAGDDENPPTPAEDDNIKVRTLRELVQWTDQLFLRAFLSTSSSSQEDDRCFLRTAALDFFSVVADLTSQQQHSRSFFLPAPGPSLFYRLLLSRNVVDVDRLCRLLVSYRRTYLQLKHGKEPDSSGSATGMMEQEEEEEEEGGLQSTEAKKDDIDKEEHIRIFNGYLWDLCCVLWLCSPPPAPASEANDDDDNEGAVAKNRSLLFTGLRPETQLRLHTAAVTEAAANNDDEKSTISKALSITHGSVFVGFALDFVRGCVPEGNRESASPALIRGEVKVRYLEYLKDRGLTGLHSFLSTFVSSLAGTRT